MKRIVTTTVFVILGLIGTANADAKPSQRAAKANLPDCTGVSSPTGIESAKTAKIDPAVAFAKRHTKTAMPASVVCESKLWQALHGSSKVATKRSRRLSPEGQRATAGPLGSGRIHVENLPVLAYAGPPVDLRPVTPTRTPPLRNVAPIPPPKRGEDDDEGHPEPIHPTTPLPDGGPDISVQLEPGTTAPTATGLSFDGVGVGLAGFSPSSNPPDVNGRIGATQYVQWNNTSFAVFDKATGALLYGPAAGKTLFQPLGGLCASHNDGDPVVSYDILAGRWVLSQFVVGGTAGSFSHQCIAVSVTGDATGAYYLYDFLTDGTNFVDYPHLAVWPDGYYMSAHVFNAAGTATLAARVYVFERDKMILGQAARMQSSDLPKDGTAFQFGFLAADLDSLTLPPAGAQEYVIGPNAQFTNRTDISRVAVVWGLTPTITLTSTVNTTVGLGNAPCVSNTVAQQRRDCVPQPAPAVATDDLDNLSRHYLHRLAYRNNGGTESIVATGVTNGATTTPAHGAIKWMEWRGAAGNGAPTLFQSGTYDPTSTTSEYRWMPSIAMDSAGNIALGYSKSSPSVIPGIYMSGRLSTDTVGTMGAETTVQAGIGVQTAGAGNRWGDYSSMTLDPVDQCTFWYTNEYLKANGIFNWSTRIASYKFPSCTPDTSWGTLTGTITSCATGVPLSGVIVNLSNGFAGTTDAAGHYSISVPNGTYTATASDVARACSDSSPATVSVTVPANGSTSQNFCMNGSSNIQFNAVTIDDATNGNNNGIINKNECVNLNVALKNNGCADESAISATLTTATAGVTISQGSSAYPDLAIDASGSNTTPFKIQTSNTFVCGTTINFTLNVTYASGSKSVGISVPTCGGGANQSIPTSSIALTDPGQPDRLGRDGSPTTCNGKACPGAINTAGTRNYKTFTFTNPAGVAACMTVQINAACGAADVQSAAYLNAYTPPITQGDTAGNLCLGYLGDSGISGLGTTVPSSSYSFTVPANATFVVVVNTATGGTTCSTFSGTVSGFFDLTPGPGACPGCVPPPTPTVTPGGPTTFCQGGSVTLTSSSATGNQWYNGLTLLAGETNQTYVATASGNYNVVVTQSGCASAPSASTAVTVTPTPATPTITPSGPTTFCQGGSVTLTSSSASGNQWYNGLTLLAGETNQTYVATASGNYNVVVTQSGCPSAPSASTAVTVTPTPATPTITPGGPTTFCQGGSVTLTSSSASGNQWYNGLTLLAGETNQTYVATASGNYNVVVTQSGCPSAPSASTTVTVTPAPATPTITPSGPTTFCQGGSVTLTSSSASGNQWYNGLTLLAGETNQTYVATASGNYNVVVTQSGCPSAPSASTAVTVTPTPATPTITPGGPTTFCQGGSVTLTSSSASGNQWYNGLTLLAGETNQTYVATASGNYNVVVTVSGCPSAPSASTTVTVTPAPATPTITPGGPTTFCAGGSVTLTSSSASGNQWYNGLTLLAGETNQTYVATASGNYNVVVTVSGCPSAPSASTVVTVNPIPPTPTITPGGPTTFCAGGSVTLTSSSASGNQWSLNGNPIGGATNNTFVATASGNYTVVVTTSGCSSAASAATVVTVNPIPPTPTITPGGPTTFCAGGSVTLTSSSASGNQWFLNGNPIGGATNNTFVAAASGSYTVTVTASGCTSAASAATVVTVNPNPNATITAPASVATGSTGNIASVANAGVGATYTWSITGGTITAGTGTNSITFTAGAPGTLTLNVTVTTSAGCSDAKSANVTVTPSGSVTVTSVSPTGGTIAGGSAVTINGTGFNAGATVTFGGSAATNVIVVSSIKITARTPAHAAGSVNVTVTNTDTTNGTLAAGYLYKPQQFDPNNDGTISPMDIFYLVNYLYMGGPPPNGAAGLLSGDANGDGSVDPLDIFYLVNYLFLGGPRPNALPDVPRLATSAVGEAQMAGSITLGKPALRDGRYVVPVIMTAGQGSLAPQAMSLQVHFDGEVGNVTIRRAGAARDLNVAFETDRRAGNDLSYLVSYGNLTLGATRSAVVAEIEIEAAGRVGLNVDPKLTMLGNQGGTMKATVSNGKLKVIGTTIGTAEAPRRRTPGAEVN